MYFDKNINHLAEKGRWKNADLARELNISPQQVSRYFSGKYEPKMETLVMFAKFFDVTVDDLILTDLTKEEGRPFGGGVESADSTDKQTDLVIRLLTDRVLELEEEMKRNNPELARDLGIE